jgi:protein-S-isoprenylcysteine O-methyltransferase Ste14
MYRSLDYPPRTRTGPAAPTGPLVEPEPEGVATWNPSTPWPMSCPGAACPRRLRRSRRLPGYDASVRRTAAAAGSAIFLVVAPGATAVLIPWLLTGWQVRVPPPPDALRLAGLVLVIMGGAVLLSAFARFALEGRGTPAPVAPTQHLVVGGLYRYVRNPMYLAVASIIVGQVLLLGRLELLAYAALFLVTTAAFARWCEEPSLQHQYGAEYEAYRRAVPGWWPRLRPWKSLEEAEAPRHRSEPN